MPARMLPGAYELRVEPRATSARGGRSGRSGASATVGFTLDTELRQVESRTGPRAAARMTVRGAGETSVVEGKPHVVVIERGDNLWSISRRVYGAGLSFPTIVNANSDIIDNPNLIFPGQVFVLPLLETHRMDGPVSG